MPGAVASGSPRARRRRWLWVALWGTVLAGAGGWYIGWKAAAPALPSPDLRVVDPKVAATIQRRLDAVRREPRSAQAWGWLGALLWVYDFRTEGRDCLAVAERLDPREVRWPYFHGLALMTSMPDGAVEMFRRATAICGNTPAAPRIRLARLLAEQGRWGEVGREAEELLRTQPDCAPARLLRARAAHARGDMKVAADDARACTDDPRTARSAWVFLALVRRQQGDDAAAAQAAQRAAAAPADEGFGDPFEAELTLLRGDARALSEQAHPLLAGGHLAEASRLIERLRAEHADVADTWLLAGRLDLLRKDLPAAEKALRRHLEMSPDSAQGLFQLGLTLLAQNRFPEAAEAFRRAAELKADFGAAHFNRAVALARAGHRAAAIESFRETLRHNPEHFDSYTLQADLLLQAGKKAEARDLIDRAESIRPGDTRLKTLRERAQGP